VRESRMVQDDPKLSFAEKQDLFRSDHTLVIKNSEKSHKLLKFSARQFSDYFLNREDEKIFVTTKLSTSLDLIEAREVLSELSFNYRL
jgi:hypothetical protein